MEKRTGPMATPPDGAFTAINSNSGHAFASTTSTEQEQLPLENTLKRSRATLLGTSPFEELSSAPVFKPVLSTPKLEADVSGPYLKPEYISPYAVPGSQDPEVKVEGQDTGKKLTRVSQACDMCHDRKTKASVVVSSSFCVEYFAFFLFKRVAITFWFIARANKNDLTVRLECPMPLMYECECALF